DFSYDVGRQLRNPMSPLVRPSRTDAGEVLPVLPGGETPALAVARSMIITGIVYDSSEPVAVVDNRTENKVDVVAIGHEFPIGIIVESIEENRVVLRVGDMRVPKMLEEQ